MAKFIISLDFELLWGVRDHHTIDNYGHRIMGGRRAIPYILDLFHQNNISATWATVGFLFCENRDELIAALPDQEHRPNYAVNSLSNYNYIDEVGENEEQDPYHFGLSLIQQINNTPRQFIGTHTLSHFYCLEDGASPDLFETDLQAALTLAKKRKIEMSTIVFPRNQYNQHVLKICEKNGITKFRGNPENWAYAPANGSAQTKARRGLRLIDAYTGMIKPKYTPENTASSLRNVSATRFLRPHSGRLSWFHSAHIATIKRGMTHAAINGQDYHLWWHPHNFGTDTEKNIQYLEKIIDHYHILESEFGMKSCAMEEA